MHGHERDCREHNKYLYYEMPTTVPKQPNEQQQPESREGLEKQIVQVAGHFDFF